MKKTFFLLALPFVAICFVAATGKKQFEGVISFSINNHSRPGVLTFPDGLTFYFKGDKLKLDMEAPFGKISSIFDFKKGTYLKLFFINDGKKYFQKLKNDLKEVKTDDDLVFIKDSAKTIKNYNCKLSLLKRNGGETGIYYTEDIIVPTGFYQLSESITYGLTGIHPKLSGKFILESETATLKEMKTISAVSIKAVPVSESEFNFDEKDFKSVTEEEIGKIIKKAFR